MLRTRTTAHTISSGRQPTYTITSALCRVRVPPVGHEKSEPCKSLRTCFLRKSGVISEVKFGIKRAIFLLGFEVELDSLLTVGVR